MELALLFFEKQSNAELIAECLTIYRSVTRLICVWMRATQMSSTMLMHASVFVLADSALPSIEYWIVLNNECRSLALVQCVQWNEMFAATKNVRRTATDNFQTMLSERFISPLSEISVSNITKHLQIINMQTKFICNTWCEVQIEWVHRWNSSIGWSFIFFFFVPVVSFVSFAK